VAIFDLVALPAPLWTAPKRGSAPPTESELLAELLGEAQALWRRIHNRVNVEAERTRYQTCLGQIESLLVGHFQRDGDALERLELGLDYFDFLAAAFPHITAQRRREEAAASAPTLTEHRGAQPIPPPVLGCSMFTPDQIEKHLEHVEHVEGLGINVARLFTITFIIAGTLSGLAGGLHAPLIMVDPSMGLEVLAFVFMVVIIGGLGSIKGTLISAFLVGQVVSIGSLIYAPLAAMAPFAIMLLILLVKPTGLYGSTLVKK